MTDIENEPPKGHVKMVYMGPVAPHWDMRSDLAIKKWLMVFEPEFKPGLFFFPHMTHSFVATENVLTVMLNEKIFLSNGT